MKSHLKNCWFTVYPEGHHIPRHSHPASQFSGVYYFDVTEESGDITFYDPISDFRVWYDEGANPAVPFRPFSEIKIHPETGMFLVFPSWLPHSTLPNKSKRDRIIFSFNFDLWIQKPEHTNNGDCSAVECLVYTEVVTGSIPVSPMNRGVNAAVW